VKAGIKGRASATGWSRSRGLSRVGVE